MDAAANPDVIRRPASPRLARLVSSISFYRERGVDGPASGTQRRLRCLFS
ncbi:hypothetical protein LUI11_31940 [Bradyrhizobium diazoefficiens]|nr:hypothetical protein [Bradyrhizobium diazoefficiens]MCD9296286.1 hypothetical protein [Bradyrhizobium diazoefficiens]MCD9813094.1 hypothetical protein [Bradyrhizobium diazoefficiens]MCD9831819.1 hypothetical protein [Bradyrhizobium diazoefficiens]MCD9849903.1 hypothetical protein [Bradyrhizobium diazoefficiens]MCD9887391.1 hypothetical protein [Bradyrhizobium diazoefficiens]